MTKSSLTNVENKSIYNKNISRLKGKLACEDCLSEDLTKFEDDPERDTNYYCNECKSFTYTLNPCMLDPSSSDYKEYSREMGLVFLTKNNSNQG